MSKFVINENDPVLVEMTLGSGVKQVAISPTDIVEKSSQALDKAMNTIHHMARRVSTTIEALSSRPTQVEVGFGLKLDAEAGAIISKAGMEASLNSKLIWES